MSSRLPGTGSRCLSTWASISKYPISQSTQQQQHRRNRSVFPTITSGTTIMSGKASQFSEICSYTAPTWTRGKLSIVPQSMIKLAHLPTPIHKWSLPRLPDTFSLSIKRDDLTGNAVSGNKVRKLEFLLADAISKGYKHVVTCGGIQSNHCRATAVAAAQVGLQPHLFLREDVMGPEEVGCQGNLLLNRLSGAKIYLIPRKSEFVTDIKPRMDQLTAKIKEETGEDVYQIPIGGSNDIGVFGYVQAFEEMIQQDVLEDFDDIVFACGSGGTATGLAVGNYLTGSRVKIHGIIVSDATGYFVDHVNATLDDLGIHDVRTGDILDIIEGYKGTGYGISTQDELDFIIKVATETSIMLDPVYSGKAAYGLVQELTKSPNRFKGKRILFIHTGGLFGLFDGRMDSTLKKAGTATNQVFMWPKIKDIPTCRL